MDSSASPMAATPQIVKRLTDMTIDDMPRFEIAFLKQLADGVAEPTSSPATDGDALNFVRRLLAALLLAPDERIDGPEPTPDAEILAYRNAFVDGAHTFAARDAEGIAQLVTRSVNTTKLVLDDHRGNPDGILGGLYIWLLVSVASGADAATPALSIQTGVESSLKQWVRLRKHSKQNPTFN